ncbi:MAG: phosphoribosylformylglycinamidine cyclo-ligase [Phycisphaerales bacterium]
MPRQRSTKHADTSPPEQSAPKPARRTYADAGVSIEQGDEFVRRIQQHVRRTHGQRVIHNPFGFAGLFRLDYNEALFKRNFKEPVLVACTDGVGTKLLLAHQLNDYSTVGIDLVAMNVNDLVVQSAEPLLFLDYIACGKVDLEQMESVIKGIADACAASGAALIGGETAEMPGLYKPGEIDLAGFALGVVELARATDPTRVEPGDIVLGLASSGVHSNGFTLVRAIVEDARLDLHKPYKKELAEDTPLAQILLRPTRLYADPIVKLLRAYKVKKVVTGMAHITGGGLAGNLERALHERVDAHIDPNTWTPSPIFRFLQDKGGIDTAEMDRVFNMGIGYTLIVRPSFANAIAERLTKLGQQVTTIGEITKGTGQVHLKPRRKRK